ncbi:hypothetical protein GW17_00003463 [Ensete ventricosum]|nr:hypothetical protein GW17_00003463 [Ensete ventricosum]
MEGGMGWQPKQDQQQQQQQCRGGWGGWWRRASSWDAGPMRAGRRTRRTSSASTAAPASAPTAHPLTPPTLSSRSAPPLPVFLPSSSMSALPELTNHLPSFLCSTHKVPVSVRRYVYNDVVRLDDLEKLIDCSYVQVDHVLLQGEDLSSILFRFNDSDLAFSHFENLRVDGSDLLIEDDGQVTPSSTLEERHGCSASANGGRGSLGKKKKTGGFFPQIVLSLSNRRKGAPHRSPLS